MPDGLESANVRRPKGGLMSRAPVTLIVSDLHMGGGPDDPGDDFVYQRGAFEHFLDEQLASRDGRAGRIELIFNGDTFELAQVRPEVYTLGSARYWCSRDESLQKLRYVLEGHKGIFDRLHAFVTAGNSVTMAAGNHDVELYWPAVQAALRDRIGPIAFELNTDWYTRYGGRLAIAHGHMLDPANRFDHWDRPILNGPDGERLEMCPGTLFMVKFVNILERQYPFADNLHPVTALADILAKDRWSRLAAAGWLLSAFAVRHPGAMLETDSAPIEDHGVQLQRAILGDPRRFRELAAIYRREIDTSASDDGLRARVSAQAGVADVVLELMAVVPLDDWLSLAGVTPTSLSLDADGPDGTLAIYRSGRQSADELLRAAAEERIKAGASLVVMGHTHQTDILATAKGQYFNPGSWTRYVNAANIGMLTIEDLKDESSFPYQLNYVRVDAEASDRLTATMITFEERAGFRFGQRLNLAAPTS
jgi:UDP-2,3-diacylglucosamine pyrophosphatase LpxH